VLSNSAALGHCLFVSNAYHFQAVVLVNIVVTREVRGGSSSIAIVLTLFHA
jgi:hypothetical protein